MIVTQSCLILCDPIDCNPPGFSVHQNSPGKNTGVGCHAMACSKRSFTPRDHIWVSWIAGRLFTIWATREALKLSNLLENTSEVSSWIQVFRQMTWPDKYIWEVIPCKWYLKPWEGKERKAEREKQTCQNINICYIQMKIHWYLLYCCNFSKGFNCSQ